MPVDGGLRNCKCGQFYLLHEATKLGFGAEPDTLPTQRVVAADLADATGSSSPTVELVARREYWKCLNDPYRELYRAHREAEEAETQRIWEAAHSDQSTWWQRFSNTKRVPKYVPSPNRPITYPKFEPSEQQRENMLSLLRLLSGRDLRKRYAFEISELYRELGQFAQAALSLTNIRMEDEGFVGRLLVNLIEAGVSAPVRYRL